MGLWFATCHWKKETTWKLECYFSTSKRQWICWGFSLQCWKSIGIFLNCPANAFVTAQLHRWNVNLFEVMLRIAKQPGDRRQEAERKHSWSYNISGKLKGIPGARTAVGDSIFLGLCYKWCGRTKVWEERRISREETGKTRGYPCGNHWDKSEGWNSDLEGLKLSGWGTREFTHCLVMGWGWDMLKVRLARVNKRDWLPIRIVPFWHAVNEQKTFEEKII